MRRLLLTLAVLGCASRGTTASSDPPERVLVTDVDGNVLRTVDDRRAASAVIPGPPERVWGALAQSYGDLGIEVSLTNVGGRQLGNPQFTRVRHVGGQPMSLYVDCGTDGLGRPRADAYRIEMSLLSSLTPAKEGGTELQTRLVAQGREVGSSNSPVHCSSTGKLEQRLADQVRERMKA